MQELAPQHADSSGEDARAPRVLVVGETHLAEAVCDELTVRGATVLHGDESGAALGSLHAAVFCDGDDVANITRALSLRAHAPHARLVLRSFNTRMRERLPELLGDCVVLSTSRIAAAPLCDLAIGAGGPGSGPARRRALTRLVDRMRGGHGAAVARQLWRRPLFRWALALMVVLVIVQSAIAASVRGYDALEALHAGVAAITTLGFQESGLLGPSVAAEAPWIQTLAVATALLDVVLVTILLGLVADALVSERFARVFGGSARRMSGHVVIAGLGTVGFRILQELCERGYRCAVIEADEEGAFLPAARRLGAHVTIADVRQEEEFSQLGLERAIAFIAVTDDDAANLEAAFTANSYAPELPIVVRCFDPELARRLETLPSVSASRSVARLAAPEFVRAALGDVSS